MAEIGEWLRNAGLGKYAARFEEEEVTVELLPHLTEADLQAMGMPIGARRALMLQVERARTGLSRPPAPSTAPPSTAPETLAPRSSPTWRQHAPTSRGPERRQLTVMFCDLVGSTTLAASVDAEELHALIHTYRSVCGTVVERYGGHVAQYLGDGLMVYFGWPEAVEDAAERAVRSGLEMARAVQGIRVGHRFSVRVGIATGTVVVGEVASLEPTEARLAIGETPNLAARVQSVARPDEVVVTASTRRLLGEHFSFSDLGPTALKGFAAPIQLWRVDEVRRTKNRFSAARAATDLSPIIGRHEETALLVQHWQEARRGQRRIVTICGEPGIGKSRLLQALRHELREPHEELHYQCSPFSVNSAFSPFLEALEAAAGLSRDEEPERRLDRLEAFLATAGVVVAEVAPFLATLLSLPTDRYPNLALSPQKRKERTFDALLSLVEARARRGPLLVVIEDTHWLDPTSAELLALLFTRLEELPILFVTTHRPEGEPAWRHREDVVALTLQRLDRRHSMNIVLALTEGLAPVDDVMAEILARTDGVPLYVEELTKSLLESGVIRKQGEPDSVRWSPAEHSIPASLRDSLMARLDRLGEHKELAQIGACFGREFSRRLLERVAPLRGTELERALARIVESGLMIQHGSGPAATYVFKHALVQDTAYDSLLRSRRRELHAAIAAVLESEPPTRAVAVESLAHHHTQAGNVDEAIRLWRRAGILAVDRVALREASAHFQRGLSLVEQLPPSPERDELELTIREPLNAARTGLHGWAAPEVAENAGAILQLTSSVGNPQSRILAMWWMWTTTITQGRIADSLRWALLMLEEGERTADVDLQLFGHAAMMAQRLLQGELLESRREAEVVLSLYDPQRAERWIQLTGHDLRTFVEVYRCQLTWMLGYPDQSRQQAVASTAHARTVGHAFNLVWALTFSSYAHAYARDEERVVAQLNEAEHLAEEQALAFISLVSVPQARGVAETLAGNSAEAQRLLRLGIERWTGRGGHVRIPYLKLALAEATAHAGEPEAALQLVEASLEQIARPGWQELEWLAEALRVKGWLLGLLGREAEAEEILSSAIAVAQQQAAKSWELRSALTLARLLAARGERSRALALLRPVYSWFTEGHATKDLQDARALLRELAGD